MYSHCSSLLRKTKLQGERKCTQPAPGRYSHHQILCLWCSTITSSLLSAYVQLLRGLINTLIQVPAEDRRHTTLPHLSTCGHGIPVRIAWYMSSGYRSWIQARNTILIKKSVSKSYNQECFSGKTYVYNRQKVSIFFYLFCSLTLNGVCLGKTSGREAEALEESWYQM